MARLVRDAKLEKREQRLRLPAQAKPHWRTVNEGQHIGYYKGARVGKWVARYRAPGSKADYKQTTLGEADDTADADGAVILNWKQAQAEASSWFEQMAISKGRKATAYTVSKALDDYLAGFEGKSLATTKARVEAILRLEFGADDIGKLTYDRIHEWHRARAASPAKVRTSATAKKQNVRATVGDEAIRRRKSTANRDLTVLKAALNVAFNDGHVASSDAWRKVKPFKNVEAAKLRYLSDDEARRVANACDPLFRPMVQAALLTGARYSELSAIRASDVDLAAQAVWLTDTKANKPRVAYLEAEGARLFAAAVAGKTGADLVFPRPDGKRWGQSQQARYLSNACINGKVDPAGFHDLRRTYGARLAMRGVPMAVIAEALGHADDRITRRHYAHLSPSYLADTIRANIAGMGIVPSSNLRSIT